MEDLMPINMKPTKELLELAKEKATRLKSRQVIRVGGGKYQNSYYVFNFSGYTYIGYYTNEPLSNFFKNKEVYSLTDDETGEVKAQMQLLNKK